MTRFHRPLRPLALLLLTALPATAQDDAAKQLADVRKQLAAGTDLQKRLRLDTLEVAGGKAKLGGVYLDAPPLKEGDKSAFALAQEEVAKVVRERLKSEQLACDWSGVKAVEPKDHPHVALQLAANAAGAKGETAADLCLFAGSAFAADGAVVLTGLHAKDPATAKWVNGAIATQLAKNPAVKVAGDKPLVVNDLKAVEWKLAPGDVRKLFAASTDAATRRLRVDRAYLGFDADKSDAADPYRVLYLTLVGVRLGEDAVARDALLDALPKEWPELFAGPPVVKVELKGLLGPGVPEPTAELRAAVAARPALDGVRIDPGAEFAPDGSLVLAGVSPGLTPAAEQELTAVFQSVLKQFIDRADAAAPRYRRLAQSSLSTAKMKVVPTGKLLAELRAWVADTMDDARVARAYFGPDGALALDLKTVSAADRQKVLAKFQELRDKYLAPAKGNGRLPAELLLATVLLQPAEPPKAPGTFGASLTAHIRQEMAGDQKKWGGVLIERGYFDAANKFTLRGAVESAAQNDELAKLLGALKGDPKWAEFFEYGHNRPALDVVPLSDLLERVKRVAPAYPAFDGVRIEAARYDADVNLIFEATVAGKLADEPAKLLAKLLREHPTYKRRAPLDKQVKVVRTGGPEAAGGGDFSVATGARLLAGGDVKKARTWLDSALLSYPNESGVWFASAYYHQLQGDAELVRRDLYRMAELETAGTTNGAAQRKRRYDAVKDLQGKDRNALEALAEEVAREVRDGAKRPTLVEKK